MVRENFNNFLINFVCTNNAVILILAEFNQILHSTYY